MFYLMLYWSLLCQPLAPAGKNVVPLEFKESKELKQVQPAEIQGKPRIYFGLGFPPNVGGVSNLSE